MKLPFGLLLIPLLTPVAFSQVLGDADPKPLPAAEQQKRFKLPPGFEIQLVADESQIQKPININFDAAGRIWVSGSGSYPWPAAKDALGNRIPGVEKTYDDIAAAFGAKGKAPALAEEAKDSVRILSEFGADGRAQKVSTFADKLNIPSGLQPLPRKAGAKGDTVLVYSIPNIWRMEDTDGDGTADKREVLYRPFGFLDTHGGSSSFTYWIDGWVYATHGFRNHSEVQDISGRTTGFDSGNTYRFKPDGSHIEYWSHGQTNPFGLTFDPLGNLYSADCHSKPVYLLLRGGFYEGIGKQHDGLGFAPAITNDDHGSSGICGIAYYAAEQFPEDFRDNIFIGNCVTGRINRDKLEWHGSTPNALRQPDFLTCDDPWFRPVDVKLGPDGALYIADFYNYIIGHYEVPLTDPRRDFSRGRIWRVVWKGDGESPSNARTSADVASASERGAHTPPRAVSGALAGNLRSSFGEAADPKENGAERNGSESSAGAPKTTREGAYAPLSHAMPNLAKLDAQGLVEKLGDANLTVRRLATNELVERGGDTRALLESVVTPNRSLEGPAGFAAAKLAVSFWDHASPEQRTHALWCLLRRGDLIKTGLLTDNLLEPQRGSFVRIHLMRIIAAIRELPDSTLEPFRTVLKAPPTSPALGRLEGGGMRAIVETLAERPAPSALEALLKIWTAAPKDDSQLAYAARIALRSNIDSEAGFRAARKIARADSDFAERLADVALAVPTPASAEFLLAHLQRTKLATPRAGEYLRHVALHVGPERIPAVIEAIDKLSDAPLAQRLAVADGLGDAARKRNLQLPASATAWLQRTMLDALSSDDGTLLDRAIAAVRDTTLDAKFEPLRKIAADPKGHGPRRAAALEALTNLPRGGEVLAVALADPSSMTLRKRAAELIGQNSGAPDAAATLLGALPTAPWELATTLAAGLAKQDATCEQLLAMIESGKTSPALLRNQAVAGPLEKRSQSLRDRAAALTKDLPPEDARLDGVIAKRVEEFRAAQPDAGHGQQVFAQNCAVCHRIRGDGGNIGPNLDGVSARGVHRLLEDILDPNRNVDPAFRQTMIETHDGRTVAGVNLRTEGELLLLNDAAGKEQSVTKAQVKSQTQSHLSLMPPVFEQTLAAKDLGDLVAFLLSTSAGK